MFLAAVTAICAHLSPGLQIQARLGLCNLVIVVALYTFVGNSGVLSFGHVSFVALGAYSAGLVSVNPVQKRADRKSVV